MTGGGLLASLTLQPTLSLAPAALRGKKRSLIFRLVSATIHMKTLMLEGLYSLMPPAANFAFKVSAIAPPFVESFVSSHHSRNSTKLCEM